MRRRSSHVQAPLKGTPGRPSEGMTIVQIPSDARRLVTIEYDAMSWEEGFAFGDFAGVIVRLRPPSDATDSTIAKLEDDVRSKGAVAVKVEARRRAAIVPRGSDAVPEEARAERRTIEEHVAAELANVPEDVRERVHVLVLEAIERGRRTAKRALVPESSEPLHAARVVLRNWFRFRNVDLALKPSVYAIVARLTTDASRSNWLGKSTFLAAFPFAFYGWHPADYDDAWITNGCESGSVRLELSDGSAITREKARGQSTKVRFERHGTLLVGPEAQEAIARHVGLSKEDFFASSFVEQKELSRLVTGGASKTLNIVAGWLDLAPLRSAWATACDDLEECAEAEEAAAKAEKEATAKIDSLVQEATANSTATFEPGPEDEDVGVAAAEFFAREAATVHAEATNDVEDLRARIAAIDEQGRAYRLACGKAQAVAARGARRVEVVARIANVKAGLGLLEEASGRAKARKEETAKLAEPLLAAEREAGASLRSRKMVARGEFDGACPVAPIDCPAKAKINGDREAAKKALEEGEKVWRAAKAQAEVAKAAADGAANAHAEADAKHKYAELELARLEKELGGLPEEEPIAVPEEPPSAVRLSDRVRELTAVATNAKNRETLQRAIVSSLKREGAKLKDATLNRISKKGELAVRQAVAKVLGPGGVQRSYASGELTAIEDGANAILEEASSELRASIRWGYESPTALAPACGQCGSGFAATSRAKTCPRCGAKRGPKVEEEVRIALSRRSGAAEDMGGLAVQIAASSWLRTTRWSAWRSCAIDEPFGSLDGAHSRALGAHLASLLAGRHGFVQAFVVAHSAAAMDAMPSRLVITAEPGEDGESSIMEDV
jgi:DNA repair exonuclease SbcCD ATPase subunit